MKEKYKIFNTAAGHICSECGRGFFCWTGPDESPCGHNLKEFDVMSLKQYLKEVPENKEVRKYLEKTEKEDSIIKNTNAYTNTDTDTTFTIKCTMKYRWVPHFLSMLKYMQHLGGVGSSRVVAFYADGDGDFRPKFEWNKELLSPSSEVRPVSDEKGDRLYDAG